MRAAMVTVLALSVTMLGLAVGLSQAQRTSEPQRPSDGQRPPRGPQPPTPPPPPGQVVATICSNDAGWCPLLEGVVIVVGTPCQCFVPGQGYVGGVARYFNYAMYPDRPVSPYFNPHWTDLPPPPPVLR